MGNQKELTTFRHLCLTYSTNIQKTPQNLIV